MKKIQQRKLNRQLFDAVQEEKAEEVNTLIGIGANIDKVDEERKIPLYYATESGNIEIVRALINAGANVNIADDYKCTPLCCAAESGYTEIVKALIKVGANVNKADCNSKTPLYCAVENDHLEVVQALMDAGADFNIEDCSGKTPLYCAIENRHLEIFKVLINAGADFDTLYCDSKIFLCYAVKKGDLDIVKYLVEEKNIDVNVKNDHSNTPLHLAVKKGYLDIVKYLIEEKNIDVNVKNDHGNTPLHLAVKKGYLDIVKYLIEEKNIDVNVKNDHGNTPLHLATENGCLDIVEYLNQINKAKERRYLLSPFYRECSSDAGSIFNQDPQKALSYTEKAIGYTKNEKDYNEHFYKYDLHIPLEEDEELEETEKNIIDCLKRYYNGSYKLGKDELIIILNSVGELKEKKKCEKFKQFLKEIKKEGVEDTSLIELLMIKIHRNLGENEEAWNLYCSFDQESSFYSYAIEEAKQLIMEYQQDQVLKGLSLLNISSNSQKKVVQSNKEASADSTLQQGCKKKSKGFTSVSMVANNSKHKSLSGEGLLEEREAFRKHKAESRFFDPKRNKKKLEIINFTKEMIDHRYRSKERTNFKPIDLEGKSARFIITAERLFQEKVIGLSNSKQPKLGIPSYSQSDYGRSFTSFGPFEKYKIDRTRVEFQHRTESCSPSAQGISPSPKRLGSGYLKNVGRYDEIYEFFKKLTNEKKGKERKLVDLMTEFIKSHKPITLDELREIYAGANERDIDYLHRCCFLVLEKEQAQWHSATCFGHENLHLGMSVIQTRCFLLLKKGFLNFKKVFLNNSQFGVYSHKNILSNLEKVRRSCKDTEDLYKVYLQDYMGSSNNSTCVLTTEQAHKDLKEIYGGDSDTSGEEYSTDSSSISPYSSLDSLEVKKVYQVSLTKNR